MNSKVFTVLGALGILTLAIVVFYFVICTNGYPLAFTLC